MSTPTRPRRRRGPGPAPRRAVPALLTVLLLAALLWLLASWAGRERAAFATVPFATVDTAVSGAGLRVCSVSDVADPLAPAATASRTYGVAATDAGCASDTARLVVDRFALPDQRDAAVRGDEGLVRPRGSATVLTWGDLAVTVAGTSEDAVSDRLTAALRRGGAR